MFAQGFPRLIGTREEAKAIAELAGPEHAALYLDFNASLPMLLSASLREYSILHLATHGVLDESTPGFSGMVLSLVGQDGHPVFGYLKAHDIARLDLRSDLVVLSSCDSAGGVNLSGEGVVGLSRSFLSAGARRVVSTLWSVDDETSRELMTTFYSGMLRDGLDPSEALRRSQAKMMRNARTAAPYYWAGFIITSTTP
jgi:CHAT domain-containing protein